MTPTQAAAIWVDAKADLDAAEAKLKPAAEVLKTFFRSRDRRTFKGVSYACSTYRALDHKLVESLVDPELVEKCKVPRPRETLSPAQP